MNLVTLYVLVVRQERAKAVQVVLADKRCLWWLPRSQIDGGCELRAGDRDIEIVVPAWLVRKRMQEYQGLPARAVA